MRHVDLKKKMEVTPKNHWDTKVLEPNAGMSAAEKATNEVSQYETSGKIGGPKGGMNAG